MASMTTKPLFYEMYDQPGTTIIASICIAIFVYLNVHNVGYLEIGFSYDKVIVEHQYWRMITASFSHVSILHIAFNMYSLWGMGYVERVIGIIEYLKISFILVIMTMTTVTYMYHIMIYKFNKESYRTSLAIGYSCVVFGWMTILAANSTTNSINFFGVRIPIVVAPFASLIFTSILIPQASFFGHLAGIVVGLMYSLGMFSFVDNYLFFNLLLWTIIGMVVNIKITVPNALPFIRIENVAEGEGNSSLQIVNGVISRSSVNIV